MRFFFTAAALYAALVLQVALQQDLLGSWTPNLVLLVATVGSPSGGIAWAAVAGLLCDGLSGRPLGVTMLAATLAMTVARHFRRPWSAGIGRNAVRLFLLMLAIDGSSQLLTSSVAGGTDPVTNLLAAMKVASSTAVIYAVGRLIANSMRARSHTMSRPRDLSLSVAPRLSRSAL